MAQWRCDLRISWHTQLFSLLAHGVLVTLTLVAPWPQGYTALWLVLLTLVVFECIRSQKNITSCQGEIRLKPGNIVLWKRHEWVVIKQPWITRYGVLLSLQQTSNRSTRKRLWLAADSMSEEEWRKLCLLLRHSFGSDEGIN
ncbi:protein YgfX [Yersinia enterocolitica]|uniref:Inner membrane protein n=1 Tax=Yersinia enterocolitica TaxID=630 RepID=A0A9P1PU45_YEREN|nr:protein YgfX [Yersinia enterocolitica]EKN3489415.1 protein YgfX [Yersinia enterocolitica]EKN3499688.1 protein YgfX [Yersinia enterocolitica]EKN3570851.1 protein YgfX [Yersinia enterocolitica]EKN3593996.1 protein YgfX [Yersinia enterocolitica]EKN3826423.1 protein YgfX [Yersinia enterocolitica]